MGSYIFNELSKIHEEMGRLFERFSGTLLPSRAPNATKPTGRYNVERMPVSNVRETDKNIIAVIELPGVPKENIELNVTEDSIEVKCNYSIRSLTGGWKQEMHPEQLYSQKSDPSDRRERAIPPSVTGGGRISFEVQKKTEKQVKSKGMYSYEASSSSFYRKIPLPSEVKPDKAAAVFRDGLLRVDAPKVKQIVHKQGRRVKID